MSTRMTPMRYYIDPHSVTDFDRCEADLQAFWLFSVLVAGKNAQVQASKLANFLEPAVGPDLRPFEYIKALDHLDSLDGAIRDEKLGQYNRISQCFLQSMDMDMTKCTVEELEEVYGVGPKTARFFLLHSRPDQEFAVLDTHILKWMGRTFDIDVPKNTPTGRRYFELEEQYLDHARELGVSPADLDLQIWSENARVVQV